MNIYLRATLLIFGAIIAVVVLAFLLKVLAVAALIAALGIGAVFLARRLMRRPV